VSLRIVAGSLGGRRISTPGGRGTRPTPEVVREALFNVLGDRVVGARCLDLFAGSGALGIEALSRGAASVTFVESHPGAARVLRDNLRDLDLEGRSRLVRRSVADVLSSLAVPAQGESPPFDLALADPPYASDWPARLVSELARTRFARRLCLEHRSGVEPASGVRGVRLTRTREYGDTGLSFLRPLPPEEGGGGTRDGAVGERGGSESGNGGVA